MKWLDHLFDAYFLRLLITLFIMLHFFLISTLLLIL